MTPSFDFRAFLNSPSNDSSSAFPSAGQVGVDMDVLSEPQTAFSDQINFGNAVPLPDWAANPLFDDASSEMAGGISSISNVMSSTASLPMFAEPKTGTTDNQYRASIAAHHLTQMTSWLPALGSGVASQSAGLGVPGQRSQGGSHSSPSVPLSQALRTTADKKSAELTIQERRRLARRGRGVGQVATQAPTALRNVVHADEVSNDSSTDNVHIIGPSMSDTLTANALTEKTPFGSVYNGFANATLNDASTDAKSMVPAQTLDSVPNDLVKRAYSTSGFDLIGALIRVATRPNPKIEIGPVDLSCSFTVSDARHPDQPIVHCSDTFAQLTGYDRNEIIGRNCRFLQAPGGHVEAGVERTHTDNGAVQHIKKAVMRNQECQTSLINYRKDGSPFINLVTIIPIGWGDITEPVFLVGFQVDLVEHPGAVMERKPNGLYVVNYITPDPSQLSSLHASSNVNAINDAVEAEASKKAIMAQELADIIGNGDEKSAKWARVLLDNSHDMIHVLSLKGTFLYVSPSVEKLLGYKPEELVGKSISEMCHPSDVVPVFRELKDSTSNASIAAAARHWARYDGTINPPTKGGSGQTGPQVNLIMRMKHKQHGHEWVENVGKLHLEQGKGRKVVISTGRLRPIYNLPWEQARRSLNSRLPGFWFKTSVEGLVLSTSGNVSDVVEGGSPTTQHNVPFTGRHLREVINADALSAFASALKSLQVSAIPHTMSNGLGGPAQMVISTVVPSSAGGTGLASVFVYTQRANPNDFVTLQQNSVYCQDASLAATEASQAATLKAGEPASDSVFGELSTSRSSSWVFELHQLKNANKRLREEVRAQQRRISSGGRLALGIPPSSPSKTKPAVETKMTQVSRLQAPPLPHTMSVGSDVSSSSKPPSNSVRSGSAISRSGSGSGSGTEITVPSSRSSSEIAHAGVKRART